MSCLIPLAQLPLGPWFNPRLGVMNHQLLQYYQGPFYPSTQSSRDILDLASQNKLRSLDFFSPQVKFLVVTC